MTPAGRALMAGALMAIVSASACDSAAIEESQTDMASNWVEVRLHPTEGWKADATFTRMPRLRIPRHNAAPWVVEAAQTGTDIRAADLILQPDELSALAAWVPEGRTDLRIRVSLASDGWQGRVVRSFDSYRKSSQTPAFDTHLKLYSYTRSGSDDAYGQQVFYSDPAAGARFVYAQCTHGAPVGANVCEVNLLAADNLVATVYLDQAALNHWEQVHESVRTLITQWIVN